MANEQNLEKGIATRFRTGEEQARTAAEGGKASGVSRRRKRSMKEAADLFLSLPVADVPTYNKMAIAGIDPEDIDYQMAVVVGMTVSAMQGNPKSAKVLMEMLGGSKGDEAQNSALEKLDEVLEQIGGVI